MNKQFHFINIVFQLYCIRAREYCILLPWYCMKYNVLYLTENHKFILNIQIILYFITIGHIQMNQKWTNCQLFVYMFDNTQHSPRRKRTKCTNSILVLHLQRIWISFSNCFYEWIQSLNTILPQFHCLQSSFPCIISANPLCHECGGVGTSAAVFPAKSQLVGGRGGGQA